MGFPRERAARLKFTAKDQIGVDLAKRNQGPETALVVSAQFFQERCTVALDSAS